MTKRTKQDRNTELILARLHEHATMEELGQRFGITRERVRQILLRAGTGAGHLPHVEPLDPRDPRWVYATSARHPRQWDALHATHTRRVEMVQFLRSVVAELGRAPTYRELGARLGLVPTEVASRCAVIWCGRSGKRGRPYNYRNGMRRWFRLAGVRPHAPGSGKRTSKRPARAVLAEHLLQSGGRIEQTAERLGCSRHSVRKWLTYYREHTDA